MICLKNRTFAVSQTTEVTLTNLRAGCDLLEKSYFCSIANNLRLGICAHSSLWFAWKIVLLQYRKQLSLGYSTFSTSCDLLEKSYFCSIANNGENSGRHAVGLWFAWKIVLLQYRKQLPTLTIALVCVVICLKNRTFAVSQTTRVQVNRQYRQLWFAWKIVLLQYRKQQEVYITCIHTSCDLLEKSYFCSIANNLSERPWVPSLVVICLKNRTFAVSQTTAVLYSEYRGWLWFAWKIVLLQYRKQPNEYIRISITVVICLKNRTFAVSQTTIFSNSKGRNTLWFAWKIVLLQYRKQLTWVWQD